MIKSPSVEIFFSLLNREKCGDSENTLNKTLGIFFNNFGYKKKKNSAPLCNDAF
jgi:hypothetical protein